MSWGWEMSKSRTAADVGDATELQASHWWCKRKIPCILINIVRDSSLKSVHVCTVQYMSGTAARWVCSTATSIKGYSLHPLPSWVCACVHKAALKVPLTSTAWTQEAAWKGQFSVIQLQILNVQRSKKTHAAILEALWYWKWCLKRFI